MTHHRFRPVGRAPFPFMGTVAVGVFLLFTVVGVYQPILEAAFRVVDDTHTFRSLDENAPLIRRWWHYLQESYFHAGSYYRPLVKIVYDLLKTLWGSQPRIFYGFNLLIHALNAWIFFCVARSVIPVRWAAAAALLFAVHPLHWEAVLNIAGLSVLMQTMFSLGALCMVQKFFEAQTSWRYGVSLMGCCLCFLGAMLSKESGFMTPVVCVWFLWTSRGSLVAAPSFGHRIKPLAWLGLLCVLLVAGLRWHAGVHQVYAWRSPFEMIRGFLTFWYGFFFVLIRMLVPWPLVYDRGQPLLQGQDVAALCGIMAFYGCAVLALWRRRDGLPTGFVFGAGWSLLTLVPVSQWWVTIGVRPGVISMADHLFYETSLGLILMALSGMNTAVTRRPRARSAVAVALVVWLAAAVMLDRRQARLAVSEPAMLAQTLRHQPFNSRVARALGYLFASAGMFEEAAVLYEQAARHDPWDVSARIGWGRALIDQGRIEAGLKVLQQAEGLAEAMGHQDPLLQRHLIEGYRRLAQDLRDRLDERPDDARLWYRWGTLMARVGDLPAAYEGLKKAYALKHDDARILFNLSQVASAVGDRTLADETARRFQHLSDERVPDELKPFHRLMRPNASGKGP